jgi:hypothetical protein
MPVVLFVLIKLVVEAIRSALRKTRPVKPQPLCGLLERAPAVRRGRKACDLLHLRRDGAPLSGWTCCTAPTTATDGVSGVLLPVWVVIGLAGTF